MVDYSRDKNPYRVTNDRRLNIVILSTQKYVIKSLHGDIFLGYEFILRFDKFIALGFASYDKFASLNIKLYPKNSNHVSDANTILFGEVGHTS